MQDEIKAGAKNINFKEYSYYYYEVGLQLYRIFKSSRIPGKTNNDINTNTNINININTNANTNINANTNTNNNTNTNTRYI